MSDLHHPKTETFDIAGKVNTDPKGFRRQVERWALRDGMLYMARPADHPRFGYLESWLIPDLDLRVNRFHFRDGHGGRFPGQDLYVDIARTEPADGLWRTTDLYVDLVTYAGGRWEVLDLEELGEALTAGYIDAPTAARALGASQQLIDGMLGAGGVEPWLASRGFRLSWADTVDYAAPEDL
ncbi:DUF402 domain-containing protein [Corynebacterium kalidii]|uniref:DUF402 domain-containing protein n=1 Tax=Corynebacterium kalidii TaxID=2931982 RepID=A0A9X2B2N7_9CORY|nr:DUF402 domain-containing protein [Corynebacterium kalidii]MCJ7859289.1 DUF402 domain-containing protein [Corynebacterium kalidii]